jgi:hypothetical protein
LRREKLVEEGTTPEDKTVKLGLSIDLRVWVLLVPPY